MKDNATLDPHDWRALRELGQRMVEDTFGWLASIHEQPVWKPVPDDVKKRIAEPVPRDGSSADDVYGEYRELIQAYGYGSVHPRFWAWVNGSGTAYGVLAEMLAAGLHANAHGTDTANYYVERQVVEWLRELFGMPPGASGLLVAGGSMANLAGIGIALQAKAPVDLAQEGLRAQPAPLVLYAAEGVHQSVAKATRLLGLGERALHRIPVDDRFAMDVERLEERIAADRAAGETPFCVVASAGAVDTGAIDPLATIAEVCRREDLW